MEDFSGCINNDDGQPLVASPNYLVKSAASKAKVHPWDGRPGTANVSEDDYSTQPMFGAMRCDSTTPAIGCSSPPEQLTDGFVAVGVFDTSPYFTVPGPDSYGHGSITVQAGAQAFPLELINDSSSRLPDLEQGPFLDFNDHGVFVSSIVAAMAPEAELTLYRSFNDQGAGYSATIGKHMVHFVPVPQQGEAPPPRVVNISGQFAGTSGSSTTFDADLVSVVSRGAVVVASAGNGNPTLPQGYPASSPNVVGISGVNSSRTSACFSNKADPYLGAYSGDGDGTCQTYDEDESVIGLIPYPMRSQTSFTFARWAGTSFASAIISAQAARELNHWNTCDPNFMADLTKVGTRQATFATDVSAYKWSALPDSVEVVNLAAMDTNCH